ncbi:50S ribosomal protein L14e [Candidatus Woesearchaeota archaeon]|nr:50S ribosomal protein L14e [Candidatus Woesearchaeota archaeon]
MMQVGRVCLKIAGRDANLQCVVVDTLNENYVLIDGQTRRKKCNIKHLEPLNKTLNIKKKASHSDVIKAFKDLKIEILEKKTKSEKTVKPSKKRKSLIKNSKK